ncbi:hypothetical protein GCM10023319_16480 [Nocardia iowensis]
MLTRIPLRGKCFIHKERTLSTIYPSAVDHSVRAAATSPVRENYGVFLSFTTVPFSARLPPPPPMCPEQAADGTLADSTGVRPQAGRVVHRRRKRSHLLPSHVNSHYNGQFDYDTGQFGRITRATG